MLFHKYVGHKNSIEERKRDHNEITYNRLYKLFVIFFIMML